jgi:hypothetical protein
MKKSTVERSPLYPKILFGFTNHPITVWAGVILLRVYFEWMKLREELSAGLVDFRKGSNNQIPAVEVMLGWYYGLLSLDTFCLKSFDATDAAFRMGCVLYNLLADFRETLLPRAWFERRLRAVRDFVFVVGADLIAQGRRVRIRLAMPQPERAEFLRRLRIVSQGVPIAAQLEWSVEDHNAAQPDNILSPIPLLTLISPQNSSP